MVDNKINNKSSNSTELSLPLIKGVDLERQKIVDDESEIYNHLKEYFHKTLHKGQKTYLMYDDITHHFKIGKSWNPKKREQTLCSDRCSIHLIGYCDYDCEELLHNIFAKYRDRGEWFFFPSINIVWGILIFFNMDYNKDLMRKIHYQFLDELPF